MAKEDVNDRKERLLGGLAGLAVGETAAYLPLQQWLGEYQTRGIPRFEEGVDSKDVKKVKEFAEEAFKKLQMDRVPITMGVKSPSSFAVPKEGINIIKWLKDIGISVSESDEALLKAGPHVGLTRPSTSSLAHELGHMKPSFLKYLSAISPHLRSIGLGAGTMMGLSDSERMQTAAPFVAAAPLAPTLAEELRANVHASRAEAHVLGKSEAFASALKSHLPAFMTYVLPVLAAAAAPLVAKAVWQHAKEEGKKKQEKTAARAPFKVKGRLKVPAGPEWMKPPAPKQPKVSKPKKVERERPEGTPKQKPPSKKKFYSDIKKRLSDQRYGSREAV